MRLVRLPPTLYMHMEEFRTQPGFAVPVYLRSLTVNTEESTLYAETWNEYVPASLRKRADVGCLRTPYVCL
jgi:hypothetical protein